MVSCMKRVGWTCLTNLGWAYYTANVIPTSPCTQAPYNLKRERGLMSYDYLLHRDQMTKIIAVWASHQFIANKFLSLDS